MSAGALAAGGGAITVNCRLVVDSEKVGGGKGWDVSAKDAEGRGETSSKLSAVSSNRCEALGVSPDFPDETG